MKITTLTGWAQAPDYLSFDTEEVLPLDYQHYACYDDMVACLAPSYRTCDVVVGWSLGGLVACKLLHDGYMRAKRLVLLAAPFQYVASEEVLCGVKPDEFALFQQQVAGKDAAHLLRFQKLITHGDVRQKHINHLLMLHADLSYKDYWLGFLQKHSCIDMLSCLPEEVIIVYGTADVITRSEQVEYFTHHIPRAQIELWEGCAHAPHLHDLYGIQQLIIS